MENQDYIRGFLFGLLLISQAAFCGSPDPDQSIPLFKRYLDIIHVRYVNTKGNFHPLSELNSKDVVNINALYEKNFKTRPLQNLETAGNAEAALAFGLTKLQTLSKAKRLETSKSKITFEKIPIEGEDNPNEVHVTTITRVSGLVELLTHRSSTVRGTGLHAKFGDFYYLRHLAKVGDRVQQGDVVRVGADLNSNCRMIFNNGDHLDIGRGTLFQVDLSNKQGPSLDVTYGKVRAVLKKYAERKRFSVKTRSAMIGVRGTDFFFNDHGIMMDLLVMRGRVHLKPTTPNAKAVEVIPGLSASAAIQPPPDTTTHEKVNLFDQSELDEIDASVKKIAEKIRESGGVVLRPASASEFEKVEELASAPKGKNASTQDLAGPVPIASRSRVDRLELKAFQMVLQDILDEDPDLAEEVIQRKMSSIDELNAFVVEKLKKKSSK